MNTPPTMHNAPSMHWGLLLTASAMLMLTMGVRQTTGLFMAPIHESTGIGIASISFALAIGQFVWGAVQPVFGAIADKHGPTQVLVAGGLMLALGTCGMTAHLMLTQAFRFAAPALLAPFGYCQIVFAGLLGWLVFSHTPDMTTVVGIGVICMSGLAAAWQQRRR